VASGSAFEVLLPTWPSMGLDLVCASSRGSSSELARYSPQVMAEQAIEAVLVQASSQTPSQQ